MSAFTRIGCGLLCTYHQELGWLGCLSNLLLGQRSMPTPVNAICVVNSRIETHFLPSLEWVAPTCSVGVVADPPSGTAVEVEVI